MLATLAAALLVMCGILAFPALLVSIAGAISNFRRVPARRLRGLAYLLIALILMALFVAYGLALFQSAQRPYTQVLPIS